jgi:hypothetical protein
MRNGHPSGNPALDAGRVDSSTGTSRLQLDFSTGCAFSDCEIVVEARFGRL